MILRNTKRSVEKRRSSDARPGRMFKYKPPGKRDLGRSQMRLLNSLCNVGTGLMSSKSCKEEYKRIIKTMSDFLLFLSSSPDDEGSKHV
jgi:hypothetical protein